MAAVCQPRRALVEIPTPQPKIAGETEEPDGFLKANTRRIRFGPIERDAPLHITGSRPQDEHSRRVQTFKYVRFLKYDPLLKRSPSIQ